MKSLSVIAFLIFVSATILFPEQRKRMLARTRTDWVVDLASVVIHFFIAPALQVYVTYALLRSWAPGLRGVLPGTLGVSLLLYALVDYAWYWNHRLFHTDTVFWNLHRAHHKPQTVDVMATSRNPLITHFFRVYLWLVGFFVFLLADPTLFFEIAAVGSVVIFWGHTSFCLPAGSRIEWVVSRILTTPRQHLWHHSRGNLRCNFGSVLSVWDRMHGTLHESAELPAAYGDPTAETAWRQLIWPF